nr:hypothetical protein [Tanacetum cinerariifolium]
LSKFNRYSFFETPKVLLLAWDRVFEIKDAFGNKQYKPEDMQELFHKLFNDGQNIHEELAKYINTPSWNRPAFNDDDDDDDVDYTIAITPVLFTEEPVDFLSMGDEHLDTIPATETDEVIKSSAEDLVSIPSESEEIEDDNLRKKLLNVHLLIDSIEALKDNPTPSSEFLTKSDFTHEEFADELAHIISPPEYNCFYFRNFLDPGEVISILNSGICKNLSTTSVNLPVEDDHSPLLAYVVWIFLAYLTYPVIPPHLHSFGNEDTIFDPGITINCFYSFKPGLSYRCGSVKKFNTHRSHLNECPMMINGKNTPILDVPLFHFYPP